MAADDDERTEEPTQQKLQQAREKGDIIYSPEVGAALSLLAVTGIVAFMAGPIMSQAAHGFIAFLAMPDQFSTEADSLRGIAMGVMLKVGGIFGLAGLALAAAALASRYLQDQPTFTAGRLAPKLDKLNPAEGFKRIFGKAAFSSFAKSLIKLAVVGGALVMALWPKDAALERISLMDPSALLPWVQSRAVSLLMSLVSAAAIIALVDYIFTRQSYMNRLKMSRRELKEEMRNSEGDPLVKGKLRQIRMERSRRRMMAAVPQAAVVITNPTHYAVALKYEPGETPAPICVALGVDDVAFKIREVAEEHNVPVVENPPLARALFATAELDQPIPREHYEAVAKVIGFVMRVARRRRARPRLRDTN